MREPMETSPLPLAALVLLGFLVGGAGHLYGSRTAISLGIGLVLVGTLVVPYLLYVNDR
jgi:hypothetical protein